MCIRDSAFGKNHCTQHRIDYDTLYSHVLRKIRECARAALMLSLIHISVQQMEKRGIQTNIGNLNREIKAANRLMQSKIGRASCRERV